MTAPLIGLTMYPANREGSVYLHEEYVDSVRRAGGVPLLIAPGEPHLERVAGVLDALVLTGGGDLDPRHYGGDMHPSVDRVDAARDATELQLAGHVLTAGLPCLCICRGAQVLNVALGGTLVVDLPGGDGLLAHRTPAGEPTPHAIALDPGSRVAAVMGVADTSPLSKHHQAIDRLGRGLTVTARAPDGVIEAVELPDHPWLLAVQWHPELTAADDPAQQKLFDAVVAQARQRSSSCA